MSIIHSRLSSIASLVRNRRLESALPTNMMVGSSPSRAARSSTMHQTRKNAHDFLASGGTSFLIASLRFMPATVGICWATRMSALQLLTTIWKSRSCSFSFSCCFVMPSVCCRTAKMSIQTKSSSEQTCPAAATRSLNGAAHVCEKKYWARPVSPGFRMSTYRQSISSVCVFTTLRTTSNVDRPAQYSVANCFNHPTRTPASTPRLPILRR
mmetsp:Transcript_2182/g.4472  ORF Transcript_2182/g.4472 Transcript_2182/m.4472 type:complete len:211 (+) Transcript_2182:708-1340(+)